MNRTVYDTAASDNSVKEAESAASRYAGEGADASKNALGIVRSQCAAFSGYRAYKFAQVFPGGDAEARVRELLRPVIIREYAAGTRTFYTGMASGFDLWSAAEVAELRAEGICPEAQLIAVEPYSTHRDSLRTHRERLLYERILAESQVSIILADGYYEGCFLKRNDYLLDNVSRLICYYDGRNGGTRYTFTQAARRGIKVINLCSPEILF